MPGGRPSDRFQEKTTLAVMLTGILQKKRTNMCQQIYVFTALSTIYKAHFCFLRNKKKWCLRDMRQLPTQDGLGTSSSNSRDDFALQWPIEMCLPTSSPSTCRLCIKQTFSYSGSTTIFPKEITAINETLYFTDWSITIIPLNLFSLIFPSGNLVLQKGFAIRLLFQNRPLN